MFRLTDAALDLLHAMVGNGQNLALTVGNPIRGELLALQGDDTKNTFEIAADLATFTIRNRPFGDHSRSMAWLICDTFLRINGVTSDLPEFFAVFLIKDLEAGRLGPAQLARALQDPKFKSYACA